MFGLNRKKLTKKEALGYIKDEVERYSFRFRLYCKDAYGTGQKIPRIEKVFFLRAKTEILNLIDSPLSTVDEEYWLRLVNAFGFLRASFERITILASSRDVVRLPLCLEYLEKLQQEKSDRYKMRRQQHDDRKKIYQMCKEQGMTDADAYREIISIEEPNLKPGTASYISAMNRLKMWKSRHKKEM